jgi:hypothetical protein
VIQTLFPDLKKEKNCWPLSHLKYSSDKIFYSFVNRIQLKILDHPTSLQARVSAWTFIDYEHCDTNKLFEKAQQLITQFDKDSNTLWINAFQQIISSYTQQQM